MDPRNSGVTRTLRLIFRSAMTFFAKQSGKSTNGAPLGKAVHNGKGGNGKAGGKEQFSDRPIPFAASKQPYSPVLGSAEREREKAKLAVVAESALKALSHYFVAANLSPSLALGPSVQGKGQSVREAREHFSNVLADALNRGIEPSSQTTPPLIEQWLNLIAADGEMTPREQFLFLSLAKGLPARESTARSNLEEPSVQVLIDHFPTDPELMKALKDIDKPLEAIASAARALGLEGVRTEIRGDVSSVRWILAFTPRSELPRLES